MDKARTFALVVISILAVSSLVPVLAIDGNGDDRFHVSWQYEQKRYGNFTDLGNYVIRLDDVKEVDIDRVIGILEDRFRGNMVGCTAFSNVNHDGEVIIGRNYDFDISHNPICLITTSCGEYRTSSFAYTRSFTHTYHDIISEGRIDPDMAMALPYISADVLNEKGLYMEANMREEDRYFSNTGTHEGLKRAPMVMIPMLVAQNCSNVHEAIEYIGNSYSYVSLYSEVPPMDDGVNVSFVIADAEGNHGLIEIARNKVSFLPSSPGHANFYITPEWADMEAVGTGFGRFAWGMGNLSKLQDIDSSLEAMREISWSKQILSYKSTYRCSDGSIAFVDPNGAPTYDWRSDKATEFTVSDDGRLLMLQSVYEGADPYLRSLIDAAVERDQLVLMDDDSLYALAVEKANVYKCAAAWTDTEGKTISKEQRELLMRENRKYWDYYYHLVWNCSTAWVCDDSHFEALKAAVVANNDAVDIMQRFFDGDEEPFRSSKGNWFTDVSSAVNCAQKEFKLRIWEKEDLIISFKW